MKIESGIFFSVKKWAENHLCMIFGFWWFFVSPSGWWRFGFGYGFRFAVPVWSSCRFDLVSSHIPPGEQMTPAGCMATGEQIPRRPTVCTRQPEQIPTPEQIPNESTRRRRHGSPRGQSAAIGTESAIGNRTPPR